MNLGLIKSFIPMVKPHLPKVEEAIANALQGIELHKENGEAYAGFVVVESNPGAKILCCAFSQDDKVVRVINSTSFTDFLLKLIEKAK